MSKTHKVFNLIILDESGSMNSVKSATIEGFNEVVQTIKGVQQQFPEQEHTITLVTFNGLGIKTLLYNQAVTKLDEIDGEKYRPSASTPLYDAIGDSVSKLRLDVERVDGEANVLVTILTDGYENASKEYKQKDINSLIAELRKKNWTFTYIGADHDVERVARSISISNTLVFKKDSAGMKKMFDQERAARSKYSQKLRNNEEVDDDYYS
jgi:uncharacterized protein YegL